MPALSFATPQVLTDPGYLFWAPLATAEPANSAVGYVFDPATNYVAGPPVTWATGWVPLGTTEDGAEFSYETKVEPISVAELFDPVTYRTTDRSSTIAFNLANFDLNTIKRVMNGGTIVTTGTTSTTISNYVPVTPGNEVRCMIGWESLDHTVRLVCYQCINGGSIKMSFKRAPSIAVLPCTFNLELPTTGIPFKMYGTGTTGTTIPFGNRLGA